MDRLQTLLGFFEEDPDDAFTRFAIAQEYLKRDATSEALHWFEHLVADQPGYVGTYYHLGKLQERLGQKDEAEATYRAGIRVAQQQRDVKNLAELQDALLLVQGVGFEDEED